MTKKHTLGLVCAGLILSIAATADSDDAPQALSLDDFRAFTDAFNLVRQNYVEEIDARTLLDSAIAGMVAELDTHSAYLDKRRMQRSDETNRGRYGGVGIEIEVRNARMYVEEVVPNSPAKREGVRSGDQVLAIDGVPVKGRDLDTSFRALHGEPGSEVLIRFGRAGSRPRDINLTRTYIPVQSVRAELLEERIAYLNITHFHTGSAADFRDALDLLRAETGGESLDGILLDLRDNTGGVIAAATAIADGFLDEGLVVYTEGRYAPARMAYYAESGQWAPGVPVAVLVNRMTASASEILAAALQDHGRAEVLGQTTFGKGTVQSMMNLRNGGALKLTTARFYRPSGESIDQVGVTPDVVVEVGESGTDTALELALERLGG